MGKLGNSHLYSQAFFLRYTLHFLGEWQTVRQTLTCTCRETSRKSYCAVTKVSPIFLVPRLAHGSQYNVVDMLVFVQLTHGIRGEDVL